MKLLNLRWRREDGEPILERLVWDDGKRVIRDPLPLPPYFFVREKNKDLALEVAERRGIDATARRGNYETADTHEKAVKIEVTAPSDVPKIRDVLEAKGARCYEADLPYASKRVLIDKQWSIVQPDNDKILFFDIEVDARKRFPRPENPDQRIILILARDMNGREYIFDDRDEEELLRKFLQTAYRYQVVCGYNIDNFDTPYILARANVLGIEIDSFLYPHYDFLKLYKEVFKRKQESYSLASVSKRILGIELEDWGADSADKVRRMYEMWRNGGEELKKLHAYTRSQVEANTMLEEKLRLIPMRAMICSKAHLWPYTFPRMYMRASIIENLILSRQVERENESLTRFVFPSRSEEGEKESYVGGFVMDPPRGIIENVAVLDLVSIYPAIIMAFNIGFETWRKDKSGEILAPHGSFVKNPRSSAAEILDDLIELRSHYKKLRNQYHPDSAEYKIYDGLQFGVKFVVNCFTPDHRVLTPQGLKYFWELRERDEIYTLNPSTFEVEISRVKKIICEYFEGDLVVLRGKHLNFRCTPTHRWFVRPARATKWRFVEADSLPYRIKTPLHHSMKGRIVEEFDLNDFVEVDKLQSDPRCRKVPCRVPAREFLELMGWYISEGHCGKDSYLIDFANTNPEYLSKIAEVCRKLGLFPRIYEDRIQCSSPVYHELLSKLCGRVAREKRIPKFVFELDVSLLKYLFEAMMNGDGCWKTMSYKTSSKELALDFAHLAFKLGYIPKIRKQSSGSFKIQLLRKEIEINRQMHNVKREFYRGEVWCVEAEKNNIIFIERDGKFIWSGNSVYGVLGFEKSRLYRAEIAENITLYARSILRFLQHYFSSLGYQIVYSDTDSVFVHKKGVRNFRDWVEELQVQLSEFRDRMREWAATVYNSPYTDVLDIKIDRVAVRAYFSGKKKRYALLSVYEDDEFIAPYIHTKGFELVRGDTVKIAKRVQEDLLRMLLTGREKEIPHYLKEMKRKVMSGEFDEDLFLLKQVTKPLHEYVNPPPHVRAAREYERRGMQIRPGDKVQYLWDGKNVKIRGETLTAADRARVWEHQVAPILERLGVDELSQTRLSDFLGVKRDENCCRS